MAAPFPPDRDPPSKDGPIALALAALVVVTVAVGALVPAAPARTALSPAEDPACAEWSDGCRVCRRLADGPACSMPGIACTTKAPECLHRS